MLPTPSQTVDGDDAVGFLRLGSNPCQEEDSLHCMMLVGRTVMEKEETTSLFYSLTTSVRTDDPSGNERGVLVGGLHLLDEDYRACGQKTVVRTKKTTWKYKSVIRMFSCTI